MLMAPVIAQMSPASQGEGQLLKHPLSLLGLFFAIYETDASNYFWDQFEAANRIKNEETRRRSAQLDLAGHDVPRLLRSEDEFAVQRTSGDHCRIFVYMFA